MHTLTAIDLLSLSKAVSEPALKAARSDSSVTPGVHAVDLTVRVYGTLKVFDDYEQVVAASVPWERLALAALSRLAPQCLSGCVTEALGEEETDAVALLRAGVVESVAAVREPSRRSCRGQVRAQLLISAVAPALAEAAK